MSVDCVKMEDLPELYIILQGEVASVTEYGAFIKIPGCKRQGLVHKSHMSASHVDNPSEIVDVGEKVWVKVIGKEVKDGKVKLSLSMKSVNQGSGKDLDPNNVILDQDERRKRKFKDFTGQKIKLEAVLNTVCKKCGCKGHFAKDCFMQPGGVKYSLVSDDEVEPADCSSQSEFQPPKKKKKDKVKKQKKSKGKLPLSDSNSSESLDSNSEEDNPAVKAHKHLEKIERSHKKKKHKKHKHKKSKKRD
ncbi:nucleolar protein of 40 kDa isoform X1 [Rhincodon typus]|uniref:nucleolar protein of 40 kDa isoform X1 n=2 Tax=Rhincodon typus TaxID=259920 RepID=UPI0020307501|nr:nucleolar protein of 40 kDa isoform X1 [Rhincodon typus]XP_048472548.1 nucleolar protein of 40 kDa isoform X1 [Rhincodon typus]XP_048472549.1 nucleolar protein of 40 kDa isoform X1 [Rhincodon typus]